MKKTLAFLLSGILALAMGCSNNFDKNNKVQAVNAPVAPGGITVTAGNKQVAVAWPSVSTATSYNIYYSTSSGFTTMSGTKVGNVLGSPYTITGLTNGTTYYFVMTASNSGGESPASSQVSATPVPPITAPTGLTAQSEDSAVALSWGAVTGATTYNVYYSTSTPVQIATATKVGAVTGTSYTVPSLTNGTLYYFAVTAQNAGGESLLSSEVSASPTKGLSVNLTPGTAAQGTLAFDSTTSLTYHFPSNAVSSPAVATIAPLDQAGLPVPMTRQTRTNGKATPMVQATDTFILAFTISLNPTTITTFNVPVTINGTVDKTITQGSTLDLAIVSGQKWVDVATFVVGANRAITENIPSINLAGLLQPGTYLLYKPAAGTSTSVSNLGVALITEDGYRMADGSNGLQIIHFYDASGNILAQPTISYLDYSGQSDMDGAALTPDGSQGIIVDGNNSLSFFTGTQTGVPLAATQNLNISQYGGDGDSVAILPNGDEAVVSEDTRSTLLVISGIVSGNPVAATTIPIPDYRDGVVISDDGKVLLARGGSGLTVYSVASITPVSGSIGGTVAHSYTQTADLTALGTYYTEDGRDGMAISPADSSRAVVTTYSPGAIQLLTGLPANPTAGTAVSMPSGVNPLSVSISRDGKLAIVGTYGGGLLMFSGVDTGTLTRVGSIYQPTYPLSGKTVTMGTVPTLGITLDNMYAIVGDQSNNAVVVVPFTSSGFAAAPASVLGGVAIPDNDQLLIH